jgi:protein-tyrosine phosphatase
VILDGVSFTVLFVCTGNVCRSPMAELLFRGWAHPDADVVVSSAGIEAMTGYGIDRSSASALGQLGIDPSQHRARQFETWMANDADLILTAGREHRDAIIAAVPTLYKRTFTMKEFARLVKGLGSGDPRSIVAAAAARRGQSAPDNPEDDDVRDPYKGAIHHAKSIAEEITESVYAALKSLGLQAETWTATPAPRNRQPAQRPMPY